jgi:hypothetical protein
VVFVRPDYFVIFDNLASSGAAVEFDSLLHALGSGSIQVSGDTVTITRPTARLSVKVLSPAGFRSSVQAGQPVEIDGADQPTSYVRISPSATSPRAQFLSVLTPLPTGASPPPVSGMSGPGWTGARIDRAPVTDYILFGPEGSGIHSKDIDCDGENLYLQLSGDMITRTVLVKGGSLTWRGSRLYESDTPTSAAIEFSGRNITGLVSATTRTKISIKSGARPVMTLDGDILSAPDVSYNTTRGLVSFTIPSGEHRFSLRPQGGSSLKI